MKPGLKKTRPDPYHIWLSEIMLQQTTVAAVIPYFLKFIKRWPTLKALAKADLDDVLSAWAGLGYYARARNLHACAQQLVQECDGQFPQDEKTLLSLKGIGPYTAAAIRSIAFNEQAVAVDGNVERVMCRLFAIKKPIIEAKEELKQKAKMLAADNAHPSDFTQALMELGATICTPKSPACSKCPWAKFCQAYQQGIATNLPTPALKKPLPHKYGVIYWLRDERGYFLARKRTEKLLHGMTELPSTAWLSQKAKVEKELLWPYLQWQDLAAPKVEHQFTHIKLTLKLKSFVLPKKNKFKPEDGYFWVNPAEIDDYAFPTVMKKAIRLASSHALI
jgi:A/G-specific adenine glycosylase